MKIQAQNTRGPGNCEQISDQLGRNGGPGRCFSILPGIPVIGDDRRDRLGGGALQGVDHDQQFHQIGVGRPADRLEDENIEPADVFFDRNGGLPVAELFDLRAAGLDAEFVTDLLEQSPVRISGENTKFFRGSFS